MRQLPESLLPIVKELLLMPSVEHVKRQQALDFIEAFKPKGDGK